MSATLSFVRLDVRRMPGFARRGYTLADFSPGLNVVFGPNASGKTTTARALNLALWPEDAVTLRASLVAAFVLDAEPWTVEVEHDRVRYQAAGRESGPPLLPAGQTQARYNLALHELLADENRPLADAILRASAGGYDVATAGTTCGFGKAPAGVRAARENYVNAERDVKTAQRAMDVLRSDAERLETLRAQCGAAEAARARVAQLQLALEHTAAAQALRTAQAQLDAFPRVLAQLDGREHEVLAALRTEEDDLRREQLRTQAAIDQTEAELVASGVREALSDEQLERWRGTTRRLREFSDLLATTQREVAQHQAACAECRRLIGSAEMQAATSLDKAALDTLADLAEVAEQLRAERLALEAQARWLDQPVDAAVLDRSREGLRALQGWLRAADDARPPVPALRWLTTLASGGLALAGVVLGAVMHPAWLVLSAGGVTDVVLAWWLRGGQERVHQRRTYERLGLAAPAYWSTPAVEQRCAELEHELAGQALAAERAARAGAMNDRRQQLEAQTAGHAQRCATFAQQHGVAPGTDPVRYYWLASRLVNLHAAQERLCGAEAQHAEAAAQYETLRTSLAEELAAHSELAITDVAAAEAAVEGVARRVQRWSVAQSARAAARRERQAVDQGLARVTARRRELLQRAGLTEAEEGRAPALCAQYAEYQKSRRVRDEAAQRVKVLGERIAATGGDPDEGVRDGAVLEMELADAQTMASTYEDAHKQLVTLEQRVAVAKAAHDVEAALAQREAVAAELLDKFDQHAGAEVGAALVDFIQGYTRDRARPAVFARARTLLAQVTRGRYRLDFDDDADGKPAFRAFDEVDGVGRSLDELSSATRVQLLLAVRLAFVEEQEQGVRLPLFLDELLANSDDVRGTALMEMIVTWVRQGRQVFYFTAQRDEVVRWQALLAREAGVPHAFIDLAAARHDAEQTLTLPPDMASVVVAEVLPPEGRDVAAYRSLLNVPPVDPRQPGGAVHVAHVIDDALVLHALLSAGIERVGQLRSMAEAGSLEAFGLDVQRQRRALGVAAVIEAACDAWRVGRGRRIERAALLAADVLTPAVRDEILALVDALDGDAAAVMEALAPGSPRRVKGLRQPTCEAFENYLLEHGYLDRAPAATPVDIRSAALQAAAPYWADHTLQPADVNTILRSTFDRTSQPDAHIIQTAP